MIYTSDAAMIYCSQNTRLQPVLKVIQALINGMTPEEIITHRIAPTLSIRTILYYASKYKQIRESN
jgi:uncharacterized protein (DUF433 family)